MGGGKFIGHLAGVRILAQRLQGNGVEGLCGNFAAAPLPALVDLLRQRHIAQRSVRRRLHIQQIEERPVRLAQQFGQRKGLFRVTPDLHVFKQQLACIGGQAPNERIIQTQGAAQCVMRIRC